MNIEHLEYFVMVAETGSINKAARSLFISQPHLGKIIHGLESELGVILLQRTRHGVRLTAEGNELLEHMRKILEEYRDIRAMTRGSLQDCSALRVSMTKFSHIMESFISVVLCHKEDSRFSHQLNEGSPEDVVEDVFSGASQIGVLNFDSHRKEKFLEKLSAKHLSYHFLASVKPHILISEDHPLLREGAPVNLQTLSDYAFVRYIGAYEDFANRIQNEQGEQNLNKSKRIVYTHGRSTLLHMIGNSDFYGIGIYDFGAQERAYNVRSIPIEGCRDWLEFGYILPEREEPSPITREFIEDLVRRFSTIK